MKRTRKIITVLLATVLAILPVLPAWAATPYTPVTPTAGTPSVTHTLELEGREDLLYTFTYQFAVGDPVIAAPEGVVNPAEAVTGKPAITNITFGPSDTPDAEHKITKTLSIDWSGVSIKTPGTYRWAVTKTKSGDDVAPGTLTNNDGTTYLYAYVTDNNGVLTVSATGFTKDDALTDKGNLADKYTETSVDLAVGKTVTGSKGSKDQYFKFTVSLTAPAAASGAGAKAYTITGAETNVPATAYNAAATNPTSVTLTGGTQASVDIWLRHGQTFTIGDLPYGTSYTVTEGNNDGYTVSTVVTGDTKNEQDDDIASGTGNTVTDASLTADTTIAYTNDRVGTLPTGILLQYGAPIAGILFAILLFVWLFASRRRREQSAE